MLSCVCQRQPAQNSAKPAKNQRPLQRLLNSKPISDFGETLSCKDGGQKGILKHKSNASTNPKILAELVKFYIYIYVFSRRFYPKRLTIAFRIYIFISTCVPWESNPQTFALLTQCSTTEPHRNTYFNINFNIDFSLIEKVNASVK